MISLLNSTSPRRILPALLALLLAASAPRAAAQSDGGRRGAQSRTDLPGIRAVHNAADARNAAALLSLLRGDSSLTADALLALGSVQSQAAADDIIAQLSSPRAELRHAAAFAAGQTLRAAFRGDGQAALLARLGRETDLDVLGELLIALGRCGTREALDSVVAGRLAPVDAPFAPVLLGLRVRAVSLFALRGLRSEAATRLAADAARGVLERGDAPANLAAAAYAFFRIGDSALLAPHEVLIAGGLRSFDADARMFCASALGRLRTPGALFALCGMREDMDWRVHVNVLRALASWTNADTAARARIEAYQLAELASPSPHVRIAAAQALAASGAGGDSVRAVLRRAAEQDSVAAVRGEALRAFAALAPAEASRLLLRMAGDTARLSAAALEAIGALEQRSAADGEALLPVLARHLLDASSPAAAAAATAWGDCWRRDRREHRCKAGDARDRAYRERLLAALEFHSRRGSQHPAAVQAVAEVLQDPIVAQRGDARAVAAALSRFSGAGNVETVTLLLTVLNALGDASVKSVIQGFLRDSSAAVRAAARAACENLKLACPNHPAPGRASFDWSLLASIPGDPVAWITTNRGLIFAQLFKDEAPFTVDAFIRLARSGFYDGLAFHRVVPNFVVQGGDPMGDGCGGPPFSLRSEFSPRTFTRGCIGMASSGKDTEGSQFFIMHSSAPHLDGRYTLFGTVLDGMDVVDRLMPGDRILSIVVRE